MLMVMLGYSSKIDCRMRQVDAGKVELKLEISENGRIFLKHSCSPEKL